MRIIIALLVLLLPLVAYGLGQTVTANGNYLSTVCQNGSGRVTVDDGGGGYDSGTVTLQFQNAAGEWKNVCPTATDCQWSTGNSGVVLFELGATARVRLNVASVAGAAADVDLELVCGP